MRYVIVLPVPDKKLVLYINDLLNELVAFLFHANVVGNFYDCAVSNGIKVKKRQKKGISEH